MKKSLTFSWKFDGPRWRHEILFCKIHCAWNDFHDFLKSFSWNFNHFMFHSAGAGTKVGTSLTETCINLTKMKEDEKDVKETLDCRNDVRKTVQLWLDRKEKKMSYLQFLAEWTLDLNYPVVKILHAFILLAFSEDAKRKAAFLERQIEQIKYLQTGTHAAAASIKAAASFKAWERALSKLAGMLLTGVGFLLNDALHLGFRDQRFS